MEAGILNSDEIAANPLISHSYTMDSLKKQNYSQQELSRPLQSHFANQAYSQNKNYYNQHQNQLQLLLQKYDNPFESQISLNYDTPPPVRKPPRPSTAPQNANPFESEISLNYENRAPERKALPRPSTGPVERSGPRNNGHMVRKAPTEPQMHSGVAPISEAGATVGPSQSTYGSETGATVGPQEYTSENMPDQARYISDTGATVGPMNPFTEYKANEFHASSDSLVSGISQQQSQHLHQVRLQSQSQTLQPMAVIQLQYPISLASPLEIQYPIKPPSSTILQQLYQPYQPQYQVSEFNEFHENPFDEAESQKLLLIDEYNSPIIPPPRHESIDSTHTQGDQERASYGSYGSLSHSNGSNTSFTFGNINHSTVPLIKEPKTEPKTEPNSSENIPYPIRGSSILDNFDYTSNQKEYEDLNGKSHN